MGHRQDLVRYFHDLQQRAKAQYAGLRDLPQFGARGWHPYFLAVFRTYNKLWNLQKEQRSLLMKRAGLTRAEVGELGSKIAQLSYHYYLRSGEIGYLHESFAFYNAIRARKYFGEDNSDATSIMARLRFLARFVLVCFLLKDVDTAQKIKRDMLDLLNALSALPGSGGMHEWVLLMEEFDTFVAADTPVLVDGIPMHEPGRVPRPAPHATPAPLALEHAVLVGNHRNQIKYSELTVDMLRMLQALEFADAGAAAGEEVPTAARNPTKVLMYRPPLSKVLHAISNLATELPDGRVLLVYVSADGVAARDGHAGGVSLSHGQQQPVDPVHVLTAEDILPFTRKPLVLVVDSDNSGAFAPVAGSRFGAPVVCLLSPATQPSSKIASNRTYTFFLHSPLCAMCDMMDVMVLRSSQWRELEQHLVAWGQRVASLVLESNLPVYSRLVQDVFFQRLLARHVLFHYVVGMLDSHTPDMLPRAYPVLPPALLQGGDLVQMAARFRSLISS